MMHTLQVKDGKLGILRVVNYQVSTLKSQLHKGYTLVELLVYMGLLAILLTVFTQIFLNTLEVRTQSESYLSVSADGKYLLARLSYDMARATAIVTPSSIGSQTNNLQLTINGTTYSYALSNGNLQLTNNFGTDVLNSSSTSVSNLTLLRVGNPGGKNTVQVSFTLTSIINPRSGPETRSFQTTLGTR